MATVITCRVCDHPIIAPSPPKVTGKPTSGLGLPWKLSIKCPLCHTSYYGEIGIVKVTDLSDRQIEAIRNRPT